MHRVQYSCTLNATCWQSTFALFLKDKIEVVIEEVEIRVLLLRKKLIRENWVIFCNFSNLFFLELLYILIKDVCRKS
jgi:hypothetical protein